jgi:cytochrome oxidase Cu insertion factor (SCO1/SenC/PrrC family)
MSLKLKLLLSALTGIGLGLAIAGVHWFTQARRANADLPIYATLPEFQLVERNGSAVSLADLKGKVWVADFVFTHCAGPCPLLSSKMSRLQDAVQDLDGVQLVSFTVDPERDTPEVLTEYARRYRADPERWLFLTGPKEPLYRLVGEGFLLAVDDGALAGGLITHSTRLALVDQHGRIRAYYDGAEPGTIDELLPGIRTLLAEGG